jgi:hypothetical protein
LFWFALPSDTDIPSAAIALVRKHGDRATIYAAMEADKLLEAGDLDGAAFWRAVVRAIRMAVEPGAVVQ